uniref:Uncharacterized protein n=1 Tax=Cacopsylla melanoneura TaxID=428564 RepID=A0A8D8Z6M8_9HEMI
MELTVTSFSAMPKSLPSTLLSIVQMGSASCQVLPGPKSCRKVAPVSSYTGLTRVKSINCRLISRWRTKLNLNWRLSSTRKMEPHSGAFWTLSPLRTRRGRWCSIWRRTRT